MGAKNLCWLEEMSRPVLALSSIQSTVRGMADRKRIASLESRVAELERRIGRQQSELEVSPRVRRVIEVIADNCGCEGAQIIGKDKRWAVSWPRQIACWVLVNHQHLAVNEVARQLRRSRWTIRYSVAAVRDAMSIHPESRTEVEHICGQL